MEARVVCDEEIYAKSAFFYLFADIMLSPILLRES